MDNNTPLWDLPPAERAAEVRRRERAKIGKRRPGPIGRFPKKRNTRAVPPETIDAIRARYAEGGVTGRELAEEFGYSTATIYRYTKGLVVEPREIFCTCPDPCAANPTEQENENG